MLAPPLPRAAALARRAGAARRQRHRRRRGARARRARRQHRASPARPENSSTRSSARRACSSRAARQKGFDQRLAAGGAHGCPASASRRPCCVRTSRSSARTGRDSVQLLGVTPRSMLRRRPQARRDFGPAALTFAGGLLLPSGVAKRSAPTPATPYGCSRAVVRTQVRVGRRARAAPQFGRLASQPGGRCARSATPSGSPGCSGRVTQLYVEPRPGAEAAVRTELRCTGRRRGSTSMPADHELRLLDQAARPQRSSRPSCSRRSA